MILVPDFTDTKVDPQQEKNLVHLKTKNIMTIQITKTMTTMHNTCNSRFKPLLQKQTIMNTPFSLTMSALLFLSILTMTSCGKDSEIVEPAIDPMELNSRSDRSEGENFGIYSIVETRVEKSIERPQFDASQFKLEKTEEEGNTISHSSPAKVKQSGSTVMANTSGTGSGWSEVFGRVITEFQLEIGMDDYTSKGEITFSLLDGTLMTFTLSGNSQPEEIDLFDGPHTALIMEATTRSVPESHNDKSIKATAYLLGIDQVLNDKSGSLEANLFIVGTIETE